MVEVMWLMGEAEGRKAAARLREHLKADWLSVVQGRRNFTDAFHSNKSHQEAAPIPVNGDNKHAALFGFGFETAEARLEREMKAFCSRAGSSFGFLSFASLIQGLDSDIVRFQLL